ncbi:MAG: methyltransferase domain-containing protein, partial [Thermodesulfovibrionales bacterium]
LRGETCIEHIRENFNTFSLEENSYDLIFSVGTIHHVENLEWLFFQINKALTPKGVFVLRDYVGPNRMQFTEEQLSLVNKILAILPERLKISYHNIVKVSFINTPLEDIIKADPSESVRPQDTLPVMKEHLDVIRLANTGGTILHPLLGDIASNFESDENALTILKLLILLENSLIQKGALSSDYAFCMARKKVASRNGGGPGACSNDEKPH